MILPQTCSETEFYSDCIKLGAIRNLCFEVWGRTHTQVLCKHCVILSESLEYLQALVSKAVLESSPYECQGFFDLTIFPVVSTTKYNIFLSSALESCCISGAFVCDWSI